MSTPTLGRFLVVVSKVGYVEAAQDDQWGQFWGVAPAFSESPSLAFVLDDCSALGRAYFKLPVDRPISLEERAQPMDLRGD
jgi:hypothetical protein